MKTYSSASTMYAGFQTDVPTWFVDKRGKTVIDDDFVDMLSRIKQDEYDQHVLMYPPAEIFTTFNQINIPTIYRKGR